MPNKTNIERKNAAIMFTDIVGYTQLTSKDEEKAFQLIKKKRELLLPLLKKHSGTSKTNGPRFGLLHVNSWACHV